jgi:hypothetical protein
MKTTILCLMLALSASAVCAGNTKRAKGDADTSKRVRMAVSDQTSNFNQISEEPVSENLYKAYPKIGAFPVNELCLEDHGATIRTINPVNGICGENENCDDDGVAVGNESAFVFVPTNEATANCTEKQNMSDGASVCKHFEFTPALRSYKVDEEVLSINGQDDQSFHKTGNQTSYSIQACPHS